MKYSNAQDELRDLLDRLMDGEQHSPETLVASAMECAMDQCQVKRGRRQNIRRVLTVFWRDINRARSSETVEARK